MFAEKQEETTDSTCFSCIATDYGVTLVYWFQLRVVNYTNL